MEVMLKYLKQLEKAGVSFDVFLGDGCYLLSADQIWHYGQGPEEFKYRWLANKYNVTVDIIKQWLLFCADYQCRGITRKGRRCLRYMVELPGPEDFNPAIDGYCHAHGRL